MARRVPRPLDGSTTRVYVLELMIIHAQEWPPNDIDAEQVVPSAARLFYADFDLAARSIETVVAMPCAGIWSREIAALCCPTDFDPACFDGEWQLFRAVDGEEVFHATTGLYLLSASRMEALTTDLAWEALHDLHGQPMAPGEFQLRLFDAAFEMLYHELREDYRDCLGGHGESLLADAVTDALRGRDLTRADRAEILKLTGNVIEAVARILGKQS